MTNKMTNAEFASAMNVILLASMGHASRANFKEIPADVDLSLSVDQFGLDSMDFFSASLYMETIFNLDSMAVKNYVEEYKGELNLQFLKDIVEEFAPLPLPSLDDIKGLV